MPKVKNNLRLHTLFHQLIGESDDFRCNFFALFFQPIGNGIAVILALDLRFLPIKAQIFHAQGTPAVEAGAYVAELIDTILKKKVSGVGLHLEGNG